MGLGLGNQAVILIRGGGGVIWQRVENGHNTGTSLKHFIEINAALTPVIINPP